MNALFEPLNDVVATNRILFVFPQALDSNEQLLRLLSQRYDI